MKHRITQIQKSRFTKWLVCSSTSRIKRYPNMTFLFSETTVCLDTCWMCRDGINGILLRISVLADSCCLSCVKVQDRIKVKTKLAREGYFFTLVHLVFELWNIKGNGQWNGGSYEINNSHNKRIQTLDCGKITKVLYIFDSLNDVCSVLFCNAQNYKSLFRAGGSV